MGRRPTRQHRRRVSYWCQSSQEGRTIDPLNEKIYNEQIRLIYHQGPILVLGATLCAIIITVFLWSHLPRSAILFWLAAVVATSMLRIWIIRSYHQASDAEKCLPHWGTFFWVGTLSAGMIWGAWPLMFYDLYNTEYLLLISTIFAGMVAVSAASGSIYIPSFVSFSMPLVMPLAITHLLSQIDLLKLTGFLMLVFLAVNWFLTLRGNRQYRELLRSRFENQELLDRLGEEKRIAERAVVAKSRFLAAASHDLRQPLHAMGLFLTALRQRESDQRQLQIIDDMTKSNNALSGLFNSLLDMSRLDAEIIECNPQHLCGETLFDGLRAQFERPAMEKRLQLHVENKGCVLFADSILLERVLRNLLANAVQYTEAGHVELHCQPDPNHPANMIITLSDTGIGIPETELEDVFSEYYQLSNPERDRRKGLGLGLSIVRRLCDLMEIPMTVSSVVGEGTRFTLRVPAGDQGQIVEVLHPVGTALADGQCVLVIDDEPQVLKSMRHMLEGWGYRVILAESARDALKRVALFGSPPDIILSDFRLRDNSNGVEAVETLRESLGSHIPAVIVSGDTSPERLKEVSASHLQLLHKPVPSEDLRLVLAERLSRSMPRTAANANRSRGAAVNPAFADSNELAGTE